MGPEGNTGIGSLTLSVYFSLLNLDNLDKGGTHEEEPPIELGPRHTRAKSHDYEIVRARKKLSKSRPNTPPQSWSVVTDPQV